MQAFNILPLMDTISDFEEGDGWESLADGLSTAVEDSIILLDWYQLPFNIYLNLVNGIVQGTVCIVSNGSFNPDTPVGPAGTSTIILASWLD